MNILLSFLFILCAVYGLYQVSEKQMKKSLQSKWALLAHHPRIVRVISLLLLVIATVLIIQEDGYSIGFVSFWIFSSPLIFIFILYINELSTKQK